MATLKDMRVRIASTKATQKITKAMQMVAASKLRRAQAAAEAARPYRRAHGQGARQHRRRRSPAATRAPRLLAGTGSDQVHLLVVCTARARPVRRVQLVDRAAGARAHQSRCWPRAKRSRSSASAARAHEQLRRHFDKQIIEAIELRGVQARSASSNAEDGRQEDRRAVRERRVRRPHAVLLALQVGDRADPDRAADHSAGVRSRRKAAGVGASYEYEPEEDEILAELLPRNVVGADVPRAAGKRRLRAGRAA